MTQTVRQHTDSTRNIPAALLKGAATNLAIQALGKNLNKKNILSTLAIGALGGGLSCLTDDKYLSTLIAASVFGGGNALANKASFPRTMFKYALIGTAGRLMLNIPEALGKAFPNSDETNLILSDPFKYLDRKGVNYLHAHAENIKEGTYDEAASADITLTTNTIITQSIKTAFDLARKTKQFQEIETLFADKQNALFFIEFDGVRNRGIIGNVRISLRTNEGNALLSKKQFETYVRLHSQLYWSLKVQLYPEELKDKAIKSQIAEFAVTIGHELFLHTEIETVELWHSGNYLDALNAANENHGEAGDLDHKLYLQGKRQRMNQYLKELKQIAANSYFGVSAADIQNAINNHDNDLKRRFMR